MSHHDDTRQREIEAAAAEWVVRRDRGFTPAEQDAFSHWLAKDARHGEAYARQRQCWQAFDLLGEWRPSHSREPNPDLLARSALKRPRRTLWPLALAAVLTLVGALVWLSAPASRAPRLAVVPVDSYERRSMTDGSVVELRPGTSIEVRYSARERRIELVAGEAFFNVAKQAARPFVVAVGEFRVQAIGTAFRVKVVEGQPEVIVTEGIVDLHPPTEIVDGGLARVTGGQLARWDSVGRSWHVIATPPEFIAQALAWQPRLLDFSSTPLSDVVAEFNRHNEVQLVIGDAELGRVPIVASIRSDSVDAFVRLLEITSEVRAERRGGEIVLYRALAME